MDSTNQTKKCIAIAVIIIYIFDLHPVEFEVWFLVNLDALIYWRFKKANGRLNISVVLLETTL